MSMSIHRLRRYGVNAFIAAMLLILVIDTLPQTPTALRLAIHPLVARLGINQGLWTLFAPEPDRTNTRLKAEITYRDGQRREWNGPDWRTISAWDKWVGHRRREYFDHLALQNGAPGWESWCHWLAKNERPDLADADRGAEVRLIYQEATVPLAENKPWPSVRQPTPFDDPLVLTIEKLE
jgi:hypothetical protein